MSDNPLRVPTPEELQQKAAAIKHGSISVEYVIQDGKIIRKNTTTKEGESLK